MTDLSLSSDPEIALIYAIDRAFSRLSYDARCRVLSWAACRSLDIHAKAAAEVVEAGRLEVASWSTQ